jgi:hypothetical protein
MENGIEHGLFHGIYRWDSNISNGIHPPVICYIAIEHVHLVRGFAH